MKPGAANWGTWIAAGMLTLALGGSLSAGGPVGPHAKDGCPKPSYSPCHYWVPSWYRLRAFCHPPALSLYASGPPTSAPAPQHVIRFPCPDAPPAAVVETRGILP